MKKLSLLFLAVVCTLVSVGQNKKGWDISVAPTVFAPIAKNVDWNSKAWGQRVEFSKKNFRISSGFMQNKAGNVNMPVLVGVKRHLVKNLHVGLDGGVTFFNGKKGQFTYAPSVGMSINKRWCLEQSILRTVVDGKHSSQVGLALHYRL